MRRAILLLSAALPHAYAPTCGCHAVSTEPGCDDGLLASSIDGNGNVDLTQARGLPAKAFYYCDGQSGRALLRTITVDSNSFSTSREIPGHAFAHSGLESADLSSTTITTIGGSAFASTPLSSLTLPYGIGPIGASAFASTPNFLCYTGPPGYEIQFPDSYIRPECGDCGSEACVGGGGPTCGGFSYPCCADAAEAYSRASWFDAAYVGSGSCSCIIPKGSDLGIAGGASSAIDICAADVY